MKKLKRITKIINWWLRGSPRCCRCGKPLYNNVRKVDGKFYGRECLFHTLADSLKDVPAGVVVPISAVISSKENTPNA